jgi:hypothetical protein
MRAKTIDQRAELVSSLSRALQYRKDNRKSSGPGTKETGQKSKSIANRFEGMIAWRLRRPRLIVVAGINVREAAKREV